MKWRLICSVCNRWATLSLLTGVMLSLMLAWQLQLANEARVQEAVESAASRVLAQALERINLYQYGLRGARGAVQTAGEHDITRALFTRYSRTRDIDIEFPGARGFGFIRRVAADDLESFIGRARADGWPDFTVRELSEHAGDHFIIQYIEPVDRNLQAVGLDIASEANRRAAAEAALRTGTVQLTGPITLVQATGNPLQSFLILMPVYRSSITPPSEAERLQAGFGWSYAPLLMKEVMADLRIDPALAHLELLDVSDEANPELFFQSADSAAPDLFTRVERHSVFGRVWESRFSVHPPFVAAMHLASPLLVSTIGIAISVLLAALIGLVRVGRQHRRGMLEEQARLAAIVEGSADGIIGCDLCGIATSWNRGAEHLLGYRAAEAIGHPILHLMVPEELREENLDILIRIGRGERIPHFETERLRKDGSRVSVSLTVSPIFDSHGSVVGASQTVRDISQQKAQEAWIIELNSRLESQVMARTAELARMNMLFSNIMRAATEVSIIAADLDGVIQVFNRGAERMLGYWADDVIGHKTPLDFHLPAEVEERGRQIQAATGRTLTGFDILAWRPAQDGFDAREWTWVRKDGSHVPVGLVVTAMRDDNGVLVGFLGIAADVTAQRRHSAQLLAARDQLQMAADVAELGIWSWSLLDNSLQWNDKMFELYGQPLELRDSGLRYEHWRERIHPDDRHAVQEALDAAVRGERPYSCTFRIQLPDGALRYIQAGGYAEREDSGRVVRVMGINRDITAQRELETWLRHAKEQADAASAAKSTFLANMSHEIRTPMNAILGMLHLVQQTGLNARQNDYISKASTAARSLLRLLNDILDYSKIDAGKLELDRHPFALESLMQELAIVLAGNQGEKPVELVFDLDSRLPVRLLGDQLRLQQVVINLASNALKFTEQGEVRVRVQQLGRDGGRCHLRFEVEDTGIGISEDQLQRIFEGFNQAEASTARRFGGSGLGLVISKHLLAMMSSQLQVHSEVGKGSCFSFSLSLSMADARPWLNQPIYPNRRWRVMLVANNQHNREVLERYLTELGANVVTLPSWDAAQSGEWQPEGALPCELMVLDSDLILDGVEPVARCLAALGCLSLLLLKRSGRREWLHADEGQVEGVRYRQLLRPLTPTQLARAVRALLRGEPLDTLEPSETQEQRLPGVRLLLVEDNAFNRQVAAELLGAEGADVTVASGGLEGVERVAANVGAFDLVLMDMQMPDIDGMEATRRIRALAGTATLPVVAMTANVSPDDVNTCLAAGMNDHIGKPIDINQMVRTIQSWLPAHAYRGVATRLPAVPISAAAASPITLTPTPAAPTPAAPTPAAPTPAAPIPAAPERAAAAVADTDSGIIQFTEPDMPLPVTPLEEHLLEVLDQYFGGDTELFCMMLDMFEPNALELLQQVQRGRELQQPSVMQNALHTLKGTAATMGARRLSMLASDWERRLKGAAEPVVALVPEAVDGMLQECLQEELAELSVALAEVMARNTSVPPVNPPHG